MSVGRGRRALPVLMVCLTLPLVATGAAAQADGAAGRTLTLRECVALGLTQNPAVAISHHGLTAAREKVDEAKAGYYPAFKFSATYSYTTPAQTAMAPSPESFDSRFSVRQPLYDGGQTASLVEGALEGSRAVEADQRTTALDVAINVQSAFYDLLRRRDFIQIAKDALESTGKHVEQAQGLYAEGVAPRSDVIKAEVQASNAQLDLIRAENGRLLAKAALATAMGQPAATDFEVAAPALADEPSGPTLPEALFAAAAQRSELAAVRARQAAADAAVQQARGGLYPSVSLDASYGWQQDEVIPDDPKWNVGVTVGIPVFERRVARARINQAAAGRSGLQAAETQTLRGIELEVQQAWVLLKEAQERHAVTKKILEQAQTDLRVSEGRYQEGLGNFLEVIDARTALTQAAVGEVVSRYDRALARARLDRAMGAQAPEEL